MGMKQAKTTQAGSRISGSLGLAERQQTLSISGSPGATRCGTFYTSSQMTCRALWMMFAGGGAGGGDEVDGWTGPPGFAWGLIVATKSCVARSWESRRV
jgi:hypothetical protein